MRGVTSKMKPMGMGEREEEMHGGPFSALRLTNIRLGGIGANTVLMNDDASREYYLATTSLMLEFSPWAYKIHRRAATDSHPSSTTTTTDIKHAARGIRILVCIHMFGEAQNK